MEDKMKKFKRVVPFLLALVTALAVVLAGCDSCGGEGEQKKTLQSISVDSSNAKTLYVDDEDFTSEGLIVKATYLIEGAETPEEVALNADEYQVDGSAFKKGVVGRYTISVSYTYEEVTKDGNYEVEVRTPSDGLIVELAEGTPDTYTLTAAQQTVEIDTSKIVVKAVDAYGTVGDAIDGCTVKLYKGKEEIALTGGKATVGSGAYAIWAEKASDLYPDYMRSAFVLVYVNDDMLSFEVKSGTFTQSMGEDVISQTWTFAATYASGAVKEITADECEFKIDTMTVAENVKTDIKYTDYNAKGDAISKSVEITYSVTRVYGKIVNTYDYDAIDNSAMGGDQTDLKQSDLKGPNSFLKLGDGTAKYRNKDKWATGANVVEIKGRGFNVTFDGVGTITVGYSSTGGSNKSRVGLQDEGKNYVPATYDANNVNISLDATENVYLVNGTAVSELTFTITKPGTYSIISEPNSDFNRGCRIHSITMEDNVDDPAKIICDADFTDTAKFEKADLAKASASAPVEITDASGASTGISVTKSSSSLVANRITDIGGVRVLQLQGAAKTTENSLLVNVKQGQVKITVRYSGSSGRYIDVLNSDGAVLASSSAQPTGADVVEYTFTLDISAATVLYLGSHDKQININYLKVEMV